MKEKIDIVKDEYFDDNLDSAIKRNKRGMRKEIRSALGMTLGEMMIKGDFISHAQQLWTLDDAKNRISHQVRSRISNELLAQSEYWDEICEMRRDKSEDRKKVARLIKRALKSLGYDEDEITRRRDIALAQTPIYQMMLIAKEETAKVLLGHLVRMPIWSGYLQIVRGISVLTASKLLYLVKDVTRFSNPSKLMKYAGLAVINGTPDKPKKGVELHYNPELKSLLLGVIADNFIKSKSQYRKAYDDRRRYTEQHRPEWGLHPTTKKPGFKGHYNADARRVMVKRFVIEFWKAGYLATGQEPPTKPYAVKILGHVEEPDIVPYEAREPLVQ